MPLARSGCEAFVLLSILVSISSCGGDPTDVRPIGAEIRLLSPATQSGTPGWPLSDSVIVEVLDAEGNPLEGVQVFWLAGNGDDKVGPGDITNSAGRVAAEWTLGSNEGEQKLTILAGSDSVTVTATASIFHASSVTVGGGFACALTASGRAYCWGTNYYGQLGRGATGEPDLIPAPVAGDLAFTALTASGSHACGLTSGGTAYCWGSNDTGETGTGTFTQSVPTPTAVQTALHFTHISTEGVSLFSNSTCGLTAEGEAWCWGANNFGQLGDGRMTNSPVPVQVLGDVPFSYIETGFFHSCATALSNGDLWCWGEQEADIGAFGTMPEGFYTTPVPVHPDFRFVQVSMGRNYTCGLTAAHTAMCWGANWFGSLGTDPPTSETATPLPVAGGYSFARLAAAGFEGTHALTTDGMVYRWGSPGNDIVQATPVPMSELRFTQFDSGEDPFAGFSFASCGISPTDAVYCVGTDEVVRGVPQPEDLS